MRIQAQKSIGTSVLKAFRRNRGSNSYRKISFGLKKVDHLVLVVARHIDRFAPIDEGFLTGDYEELILRREVDEEVLVTLCLGSIRVQGRLPKVWWRGSVRVFPRAR